MAAGKLSEINVTPLVDVLLVLLIQQLEGNVGQEHLDEYADETTQRGCALRDCIAKELKLTSLEYQTLDGFLEAIGIPEQYICTYCWTGKE